MNRPAAAAPSLAPKRKPRDPFIDSRVHALVCALIRFLNLLPAPAARWLGRSLGALAWRFDARHRKQVRRHMDLAFRDEKSAAEKERLCRSYFEHIGLAVVEFARLEQITPQNVDDLADLSELKVFDELLARGKGLLVVPAHHGNWELCGYSVALKGYPLRSVARPLDNAAVNDLVTAIRERSGNQIIQKWKVLWKLKKLLDAGGVVVLTTDQNAGVAGTFLPFFGVLASTLTSPADLHLATGAPIVVASMNRKPDGIHHVFRVWDVIEHRKTSDYDADVKAVLTRVNAAMEKSIREYPEQWLWVHKRWKTRPPGELPGPDGLPPRANG
jgi:Kdo2-lipid IVA lauroyltransferase/acyltransferase